MKIREGFVSNSSSSSFFIAIASIKPEKVEELIAFNEGLKKNKNRYFYEIGSPKDVVSDVYDTSYDGESIIYDSYNSTLEFKCNEDETIAILMDCSDIECNEYNEYEWEEDNHDKECIALLNKMDDKTIFDRKEFSYYCGYYG